MPIKLKSRLTSPRPKAGETKPTVQNTVTVQLEVPARVFRRVSGLCTGYTVLGLGEVLERWVEDAAYGASRPESWEHEHTAGWLAGHPFPSKTRPFKQHRRCKEERPA